jgi:hypothetical protein
LSQLTHLDLGYVDLPTGGFSELSHLTNLVNCILYGRLNALVAEVSVCVLGGGDELY